MPSDIFGLGLVYETQVESTWPELAEFGYFGGGFAPSAPGEVSTIDRLDFSNETTSVPGNNLTQSRQGIKAVSNSSYGYFAGGSTPPHVCTIDRLDFSNETIAAPGTFQLTQKRKSLGAVSNSSYGYFGGGYDFPGYFSTIDRLDFSNETVTIPTGYYLTQARAYLAAVSNSNYGYFGGGFVFGLTVSTIDRLDFSNETVLNPNPGTYQLTQGRLSLAAVSNSNYGYFGGGQNAVCTIDRLDFSNETVAAPGAYQLTQARTSLAAVSNSNYGYFSGGTIPPLAQSSSTVDRIDFSNETVAAPTGYYLTQVRYRLAALSTKPTTQTVRKLRRGVDISENPISKTYGYFAGGYGAPNPPFFSCIIDRLDFSNETASAPGNNLTQERQNSAGVFNSNYGYFGGGYFPGYVCIIDRLDFFNETVAAPGAYQLTQARGTLGAVSNSNYGYFAGGFASSATAPVCTIDRLDFSNETTSAPGNNLTQRRQGIGSVSTPQYGYFAGGSHVPGSPPQRCTIDRLDFSNETIAAPGTFQLTQARNAFSAVFNSNYGYFAGGIAPGIVCTIDRLDFSNETVQVPPAPAPNQLTKSRQYSAAVSNSNYGYIGGGLTPGSYLSSIDRLDFSSETVSSPSNNLSQARSSFAAVSN